MSKKKHDFESTRQVWDGGFRGYKSNYDSGVNLLANIMETNIYKNIFGKTPKEMVDHLTGANTEFDIKKLNDPTRKPNEVFSVRYRKAYISLILGGLINNKS